MTQHSTEHATFTIERIYDAAPARIFQAFADRAIYDRWFVKGDGWPIAEYAGDFRVGGRETGRFSPDGEMVFVNETVILEIAPDARIVTAYTMAMEGATPFSASIATVELKPDGNGTRLVYTEQGAFFDGRDNAAQREAGCAEIFDALGKELARQAVAA